MKDACPHPGGFRADDGRWECSRCGHLFASYEAWGAETGNMAAVRAVTAAIEADLAEITTMADTDHVCRTADNVPITIGLRVIDYDGRLGTVTEPPSKWDYEDDVCWPCAGHNGHWWGVRPDTAPGNDNPRYAKSFDGSRLTTRGVPR